MAEEKAGRPTLVRAPAMRLRLIPSCTSTEISARSSPLSSGSMRARTSAEMPRARALGMIRKGRRATTLGRVGSALAHHRRLAARPQGQPARGLGGGDLADQRCATADQAMQVAIDGVDFLP